jgi:phytoene desaturase
MLWRNNISRGQIPEIAIIGAGPGGLASAMLLRQSGANVTIFERLDRVGGRAGLIDIKTKFSDFRFDIGPTFFLYPRVLADIFSACGRDLAKEIEMIRVDPQYRLVFADGACINASSDPKQLATEVARFSPSDAASLPKFMAENQAKLEKFRPVLEAPFNRITDYLSPQLLSALPLLKPFRTLDRDLQRFFQDPRVRLAFSFQSKYLGMSPFRCPSLFTILAFMEYEYGVWHPRGGCGAVMTRMAEIACEMGVRIRLREPVEEIVFEGRRAVALRTANRAHRFDALVINADFAQTMTRLVPDRLRRRWTNKKIAKKKYSCSTFMMYLGVEGDLPQLAHHTVFLAKDYRRNVREIDAGVELPTEASMYIQNAGVTDSSLASRGYSTLYVLVPVGHNRPGGIDWPAEAPRMRQYALDRLARLGVPDLDRRIRFEKILTPKHWEDDLQVYRGATFNLSHSLDQMLYFRPHNRFEDLHGVYLVGGGTHPGSGLPVIFESARISARMIAQDLQLENIPDTSMASASAPKSPAVAIP